MGAQRSDQFCRIGGVGRGGEQGEVSKKSMYWEKDITSKGMCMSHGHLLPLEILTHDTPCLILQTIDSNKIHGLLGVPKVEGTGKILL